jgi:CubicO group peptidase (beta-lactamase class C family)
MPEMGNLGTRINLRQLLSHTSGTIPPRRQIATGHSVNTALGRTRPVWQEPMPAFSPAATPGR